MDRIAVIFDTSRRPETTGVYCRRALSQLVAEGQFREVEHFLPTELVAAIRKQFDLYLFVDDGLPYELPPGVPTAWWAIDTHVGFERCLAKAKAADWVFAAQRDGAQRLLKSGISNVVWLPLACDSELHGRVETGKRFDLAFVGNVFPGQRQELLDLLRENFPRHFIGNRYFKEMAETYSASKFVFNRSIRNDINMRVFEALCSGSLLLTNDLTENGQAELFRDGVELATYATADELLDKARFYLEHDELREQIAAAGRAEALAKHTYLHRMKTILSAIESGLQNEPQASNAAVRPTIRGKDQGYFEHERPDVQELVPSTVKRVLDVGCGAGRLGAAIKTRQGAHVTGIELDPATAAKALQRLDRVEIGSIEADELEFPEGSFDCIICADVLEHLRLLEVVLRKLRRWLAPGGYLVTSLPNVRNHTVIRSLLAGNWTPESAGILDADHVRFFTRREIEKLMDRSGFDLEELKMVPGEGFQEWASQGRPLNVMMAGLQVQTASQADAAEFFAYQFLTRSRAGTRPHYDLTSIVIVTFNELSFTKLCVDSVRLRTDEPYELIFVDNGSADGTVEYLKTLAGATVIINADNRGFPAAANQGIRAARGEYMLLLNNDTLVTTGWLRRMLAVLHSSDEIGLVGPVSNHVSGDQQIEVNYNQINELDGFAWDWGRDHGHEVVETDRLVGFCLLIRRGVIEAIGELDERFGIGNFEDDDFCRRAHDAGFRAMVAYGAFVHHFGSVTFQNAGIDLGQVLEQNRQKYLEKWERVVEQHDSPAECSGPSNQLPIPSKFAPAFTIEQGTGDGLILAHQAIQLSACLIVRDNKDTIRPCLESIRPWVDEIVVVDTGSKDGTDRICEELGARVFHSEWQDSFSAARNVSLGYARGKWTFWMDSDDTFPAQCGPPLRAFADGDHAENLLGFVMQVHCPGDDPFDLTMVDHVKLIRNRPDLRFEFRMHEQILPSIRRAGGDVAFTEIHVVHSGSDRTKEGRARKLERDFKLLKLDLAEHPDHPFVLFNLGMTYADVEQHEQAIEHLTRCITVSQPEESHLRKAYALLVSSLSKSERQADAWTICAKARELFPDDKELSFRQAMLQHEAGRLTDAAETYHGILERKSPRHFMSVDVGIDGFKARHNLAIVYEDQGDFEKAETEWQTIVAERPTYAVAWRRLGEVLLKRCDFLRLRKLLASLRQQPNLFVETTILAAHFAERIGDFESARRELENAIEQAPSNTEILNELCRLLFEKGPVAGAETMIDRLIELNPEDPAAWHNLGSLREQRDDLEGAVVAYKRSLKLRPRSDVTLAALRRISDHQHSFSGSVN